MHTLPLPMCIPETEVVSKGKQLTKKQTLGKEQRGRMVHAQGTCWNTRRQNIVFGVQPEMPQNVCVLGGCVTAIPFHGLIQKPLSSA